MKKGLVPRVLRFWGQRTYSSLSDRLRRELTSRKLDLAFDYLHPQPSHLLDLTLGDLFPGFRLGNGPTLPSVNPPVPLSPGHHLVYFSPQVSLSQLLPDGTDTLHYPGEPFNRRLWAGGRIKFHVRPGLVLDGSRAVCIETIRDVDLKGREGEEKVFVKIERRFGVVEEGEDEASIWKRIWREREDDPGHASVIENRDLVFMRQKTQEELNRDKANFGNDRRAIRSPPEPEFRHSIKPTQALLSRFSALTFNAHAIHLDKAYTRDTEGFRNLLVHGPLTLTLLLTALQAHLAKAKCTIRQIEYKNLTPLYAEEVLTICGKPKSGESNTNWDVWIESKDGGLAVRGVVQTDAV